MPRLFAELGVPIGSVAVARPSLDDVFMAYTGRTIRDAEASSADNMRNFVNSDEEVTMATTVMPVRTVEGGLRQDWRGVKVVWQRELLRFGQDRLRAAAALIQPILFLFVLGTGLSSLTEEPPVA